MLRTASSLPLTGLLTLGSDPARFPTEPPACYRASWQLPGPDFHRQATTSLRTARSAATSQRHLPFCWAHERSGLAPASDAFASTRFIVESFRKVSGFSCICTFLESEKAKHTSDASTNFRITWSGAPLSEDVRAET